MECLHNQIRIKMEEASDRPSQEIEPPRKRQASASATKHLFDYLSDSESDGETTDSPSQIQPSQGANVSDARVEEAFKSFWNTPRIEQNSDPLSYWQANSLTHPEIHAISQATLTCPSGSVDSERLFSTAGNVINERRTRLTPDNAEDMIFLAKNLEYFNFDY